MSITDIFSVIGGLALFLYGMKMMSDGLTLVAGARLKVILEKLTRNRFLGMLVGALIAAVIQSSNATTVMAVGFVNAGLMDISQAVGVIIGAKVGTTVTGQLLTLKADSFAPIIAIIGVIMVMFFKRKKINHVGMVIAGLGVLFLGMGTMSSSMEGLQNVAWFNDMLQFVTKYPILGVLAGVLVTTLIQSSSASVGILQAMGRNGLLTLTQAAPLVYGMNIGACVSAGLASLGAKKDAKRVVVQSVLFSTIGMVLFLVGTTLLPVISWIEQITGPLVPNQIANLHTIFNVVGMLVMLPFSDLLVKLSRLIIRGEDAEADEKRLLHVNETGFAAASIGLAQIDAEVNRMYRLAHDNLARACNAFLNQSTQEIDLINQTEDTIDFLNKELVHCLVRMNSMELSDAEAARIGGMYHVLNDIERVGDHAQNVGEYAQACEERDIKLSEPALEEIRGLVAATLHILDDAYGYFTGKRTVPFENIEAQEQAIDDLVEQLENNHVARLNQGLCNADSGWVFSDLLTDLERVSDHAINIAQAAATHT